MLKLRRITDKLNVKRFAIYSAYDSGIRTSIESTGMKITLYDNSEYPRQRDRLYNLMKAF